MNNMPNARPNKIDCTIQQIHIESTFAYKTAGRYVQCPSAQRVVSTWDLSSIFRSYILAIYISHSLELHRFLIDNFIRCARRRRHTRVLDLSINLDDFSFSSHSSRSSFN